MELSCILAKDFQEMIVYKDANGREGIGSQEIKKFFVSFYKNLVSHNVDFYNNAVSEAKRAFSPITNYFPYLEGGKIKYKTNTNLGYDHFIYIYKVTGDLTSFYKE